MRTVIYTELLECDGDLCDKTQAHSGDTLDDAVTKNSESGWRRRNGKDYCPECSAKLKER